MSKPKPRLRDVDSAYRDGMIDEHAAHVRANRTELAKHVAAVLLADYDYDVEAATEDTVERPTPGEKENAAAAPPPETAVEPKPAKKAAPPARKAAASKPSQGSKD
ncbi:hypothetical protein ACIP4S_13055 [Streptomyces chartreusis]|uniref:hypothetical protein n=1 Tax=Streptomyces chartreusis TaxID=1969 RepID=UPI00380F5B65